MLNDKKITVVLPAYNAGLTLESTYGEIPFDIVDEVILVDDASQDNTIQVAKRLGIRHILRHEANKGYGGNQKTCYSRALDLNSDIVIMLHPDYQYNPRLIRAMTSLIVENIYPVVIASRILGNGALRGGMPLYKYIANRFLTLVQNILTGQKLSEYHTGYRAFTAEVLKSVNFMANSDNFIFDNQILTQIFMKGYTVGEVSCPTKYSPEVSSINFGQSLIYGANVLWVSLLFRLHKWKLIRRKIYS